MTCHFCGNPSCKMVVETDRGDICRVCIQAAVEVIARLAGGKDYGAPKIVQVRRAA